MTDYSRIRPDIRAALDEWGTGESPFCGDFLRAVLSNDLMGAVGRADEYNRLTLWVIVSYVYNVLPSICHGSPEKVAAWAAEHRARIAAAAESIEATGQTMVPNPADP